MRHIQNDARELLGREGGCLWVENLGAVSPQRMPRYGWGSKREMKLIIKEGFILHASSGRFSHGFQSSGVAKATTSRLFSIFSIRKIESEWFTLI